MRRWMWIGALILVILGGIAIGVSAYNAGVSHGLEQTGRAVEDRTGGRQSALNAVRHTPQGGSVVISVDPTQDGKAVEFTVTDTGPGIQSEMLPHVFDRFVKAADSGGAGLGLAIVRSLVEAHGGSISAESPPRRGTTIRFVLPGS